MPQDLHARSRRLCLRGSATKSVCGGGRAKASAAPPAAAAAALLSRASAGALAIMTADWSADIHHEAVPPRWSSSDSNGARHQRRSAPKRMPALFSAFVGGAAVARTAARQWPAAGSGGSIHGDAGE